MPPVSWCNIWQAMNQPSSELRTSPRTILSAMCNSFSYKRCKENEMRNNSSTFKKDIAIAQQEGKWLWRFSEFSFPLVYFEKKKNKETNASPLYFVGNKEDSFFMSFHSNLTFLPSFSSLISFRAGNPHLLNSIKNLKSHSFTSTILLSFCTSSRPWLLTNLLLYPITCN